MRLGLDSGSTWLISWGNRIWNISMSLGRKIVNNILFLAYDTDQLSFRFWKQTHRMRADGCRLLQFATTILVDTSASWASSVCLRSNSGREATRAGVFFRRHISRRRCFSLRRLSPKAPDGSLRISMPPDGTLIFYVTLTSWRRPAVVTWSSQLLLQVDVHEVSARKEQRGKMSVAHKGRSRLSSRRGSCGGGQRVWNKGSVIIEVSWAWWKEAPIESKINIRLLFSGIDF